MPPCGSWREIDNDFGPWKSNIWCCLETGHPLPHRHEWTPDDYQLFPSQISGTALLWNTDFGGEVWTESAAQILQDIAENHGKPKTPPPSINASNCLLWKEIEAARMRDRCLEADCEAIYHDAQKALMRQTIWLGWRGLVILGLIGKRFEIVFSNPTVLRGLLIDLTT